MTLYRNRTCPQWVVVCLLALTFGAQILRAQDQPPRPGTKPQAKDLEQARAEVCRALEQLRQAEANLRQAEKRFHDLEGKGAPAQEKAEGDFRILRLKNANARNITQTLVELLGKDRARIVADPDTNSLLIRATREDHEVIENLVKYLDSINVDTEDQLDPHVYALKSADANALAKVLQQTFGKDRVTIAVDDRTNLLIVRARRLDQITIAKLVQHLEEMAGKARPPEK